MDGSAAEEADATVELEEPDDEDDDCKEEEEESDDSCFGFWTPVGVFVCTIPGFGTVVVRSTGEGDALVVAVSSVEGGDAWEE